MRNLVVSVQLESAYLGLSKLQEYDFTIYPVKKNSMFVSSYLADDDDKFRKKITILQGTSRLRLLILEQLVSLN
eukprot:snap_masked-scaffold_2-processed-gene-0.35-mRNA-1 protein AED:1.00 eAED:1.00 QI:0/0/0/0/1/1/2/0/73